MMGSGSPASPSRYSKDEAATKLQAAQRGRQQRRRLQLGDWEEEEDEEESGRGGRSSRVLSIQPLKPIREALQPVLDDLHDQAERVVELLIEWDEDNNGTTDVGEFRVALPVLDLAVGRKGLGGALWVDPVGVSPPAAQRCDAQAAGLPGREA